MKLVRSLSFIRLLSARWYSVFKKYSYQIQTYIAMAILWFVLLLVSVYLFDDKVESKISMMDLDTHRFYMHNRSPKKLHVHRIRHTIMHNNMESYHDLFKAVDLEANQTSTFYRMYIKNAPSAEESYQDEWFAHLLYDSKNYTLKTTPFFCRVIDRDLCEPILVVFDLYKMQFHVVPPKSRNCSVGVEHNPDKDYEYKDYVELFWQTTGHGWWV